MTQYDIFKIIKSLNGRWVSSNQLANMLNRSRNSITPSLKKLLKIENITRRKKASSRMEYEYSYQL